jgi:hypothetical protein
MDQLTNQITTISNASTYTGTISIDYDSAITTASNSVWSNWTTYNNYYNNTPPTHDNYTSADKQICTDEEWEKLCEEQGLIDGDINW